MRRLFKTLDAMCAVISGLSLFGMIAINFADSIGRQIGSPVIGAQEIASFLLCIFFFASVPILVRENAHIRVGLMTEFYRGLAKRMERVWSFAFEVAATALLVFLVFDFARRQARIGQVSAHFQMEIAPVIYVSAGLMLLALIFLIEHQIRRLPDRRSQAEQGAHHIPGDTT